MKELNVQKVALVFGSFIALWHVVWSAFILIGWAQPLLNFIFWAHMLANPYQVTGFDMTAFVTLIVVTFGVGYVGGWVFAWLWNKLHR